MAFAAVFSGEHDVECELVGSDPLPVLNTGHGEAAGHVEMPDVFARRHRTRLIEIETDAGGVSISRDWPSDRMEGVEGIEADIAAMPGIVRMTLFQVT